MSVNTPTRPETNDINLSKFKKLFNNLVLDKVNKELDKVDLSSIQNKEVELSIRKNIQTEVIISEIQSMIYYYKNSNNSLDENLLYQHNIDSNQQLKYIQSCWKEFNTKVLQINQNINKINTEMQELLENYLAENLDQADKVDLITNIIERNSVNIKNQEAKSILGTLKQEYDLDINILLIKLVKDINYTNLEAAIIKYIDEISKNIVDIDDPLSILQTLLGHSLSLPIETLKKFPILSIISNIEIPPEDRIKLGKNFKKNIESQSSISWAVKSKINSISLD